MKRALIFILISAALIFTGCASDEPVPEPNVEPPAQEIIEVPEPVEIEEELPEEEIEEEPEEETEEEPEEEIEEEPEEEIEEEPEEEIEEEPEEEIEEEPEEEIEEEPEEEIEEEPEEEIEEEPEEEIEEEPEEEIEEEPEEEPEEEILEDFMLEEEPEVEEEIEEDQEYERSIVEMEGIVTKEEFTEDKKAILERIEKLEEVMSNGDFTTWKNFIEPASLTYWSRKGNLKAVSALLPIKGLLLTTLDEYFRYIFIPSRIGKEIDEIRYLSDNQVKAVQVKDNQDVVYYYFTKIDGVWKVNLPPLDD